MSSGSRRYGKAAPVTRPPWRCLLSRMRWFGAKRFFRVSTGWPSQIPSGEWGSEQRTAIDLGPTKGPSFRKPDGDDVKAPRSGCKEVKFQSCPWGKIVDWGEHARPNDSVYVDLWDDYLEPA